LGGGKNREGPMARKGWGKRKFVRKRGSSSKPRRCGGKGSSGGEKKSRLKVDGKKGQPFLLWRGNSIEGGSGKEAGRPAKKKHVHPGVTEPQNEDEEKNFAARRGALEWERGWGKGKKGGTQLRQFLGDGTGEQGLGRKTKVRTKKTTFRVASERTVGR